MANIDWSTVNEAAEFEQIPAGGYICKITSVKDVEDKEYYNVEFDIAEGPFKDYFLDASERSGYWFANFVKSYKLKARPFFKGMLTAIEHSNKGFFADKFDNDPQKLVGKQIGLVIGIEEYLNKDKEKKERIFVDRICGIEAIKKKDFKIPEKKLLEPEKKQPSGNIDGFIPMPDGSSPWG